MFAFMRVGRFLMLLGFFYIFVTFVYGLAELPLIFAGYVGPRAKMACGLLALIIASAATALAWRRGLGQWVRSG